MSDTNGERGVGRIDRQPFSLNGATDRRDVIEIGLGWLAQRVRRPVWSQLGRQFGAALSEFVLWFGLLFSAVLIGTFTVLGIVMAYALVMSAIGR